MVSTGHYTLEGITLMGKIPKCLRGVPEVKTPQITSKGNGVSTFFALWRYPFLLGGIKGDNTSWGLGTITNVVVALGRPNTGAIGGEPQREF